MTGRIEIKGPFPPPNPFLYPSGRKTPSFVYQIFNGEGRKVMGGMSGPDLETTKARVLGFAAEKGLTSPTVEIVTP